MATPSCPKKMMIEHQAQNLTLTNGNWGNPPPTDGGQTCRLKVEKDPPDVG